jgi:hypothetical protein
MADDLEFRIAKLEVKPGDVLVVKVDDHITRDRALIIQHKLQTRLPKGVKALVLDKGIDLSVLTFDEIQERARRTDAA